jgi:hypothetical protein
MKPTSQMIDVVKKDLYEYESFTISFGPRHITGVFSVTTRKEADSLIEAISAMKVLLDQKPLPEPPNDQDALSPGDTTHPAAIDAAPKSDGD